MPVSVHNFVIHGLDYAASSVPQSQLVPKQQLMPVSADIEAFVLQLHHTFVSKPAKGAGHFIESVDTSTQKGSVQSFALLLSQYLSQEREFLSFSVVAGQLLCKALEDHAASEKGFVIFSDYDHLATRYLMVALINSKEHVEVTQDLELSRRAHLDLARMQLAVRLDITQWQTDPSLGNYISFIKGRMGRKVSDFFMQFIGGEETLDVRQQNQQLVKSVDEYLAAEQLDPQEKHAGRDRVAEYCQSRKEEGEPIELRALSEQLPESEVFTNFAEFNQQAENPLAESFDADSGALRTLSRFSGQGGGVSISFDRKLLGERIEYDASQDRLVINGIPANLKDQLIRLQQSVQPNSDRS
jgi:nucleoid-associated protein